MPGKRWANAEAITRNLLDCSFRQPQHPDAFCYHWQVILIKSRALIFFVYKIHGLDR